jgi:hypothetical protein
MQQYLHQRDYDNYGNELVDFAQRSALQTIAPHLENLQAQNNHLQQQLAREARHRLDAQVAELVPDYKTIDEDPAFHGYLLGVEELSGRVRQDLLNDAIKKGSAERCAAFFEGFRNEAPSGGGGAGASSRRPRPAAAKPIYDRKTIGALYEAHRKGAYIGREAEWKRIEQDIFDSQREGRIVGPPWISK